MAMTIELLESDEEYQESDEDDLELLSILSSDTSSSSDSESELEEHSVTKVIKSYSDSEFKKHFRLSRSTVSELTEIYKTSDVIRNQQKGGRTCIGAEKEIYIFLWYIGHTDTFREIADFFGISKSGAWNVVVKVSTWLISIGHNYIKWPSEEKIPHLMALWEQKSKIPNLTGAIDCTHIKIKAPLLHKESYFNRKQFYSLHLQAVVDVNKKFIDVFAGEPGFLRDSSVLKRSELFHEAHANKNGTFPYNTFLLGDSAYPLSDWIITPFRDNGDLSREEFEFNELHSSARIVVENAFGMLKTRFKRLLHFTEQTNLNFVVNLIVCCCILHNICLYENYDFQEINKPIVADINDAEQEILTQNDSSQPSTRRQQVLNYLISKGVIPQRN